MELLKGERLLSIDIGIYLSPTTQVIKQATRKLLVSLELHYRLNIKPEVTGYLFHDINANV